MLEEMAKVFLDTWPVIVAAATGLITAFVLYLRKRIDFKTKEIELQAENLKLQQVIASGSYILCPECGKKIFLQDTKILTGGQRDEK